MSNTTDTNVQAAVNSSTAETTIDIDTMVRLSLHILDKLNEHAGDENVWIDPYNDNEPKRELDLDENDRARWKEWQWSLHNVLREEGLLKRFFENENKLVYRSVISDRGKEFLAQLPDVRESEMVKMWQKYEETRKQFDTPIPVKKYYEAILEWDKKAKTETKPNRVRASRNVKRCLAELLLEQKWGDLDKLPNSYRGFVRGTLKDNFGWFLAGYLYPQMKRKNRLVYCFWASDLFLARRNGTLLPAFREALETLGKEGKIDFEEWKRISIVPPRSGIPAADGHEVSSDTESADDTELPDDIGVSDDLDKDVKDAIDEILDDKKQIILYGPPGTGKTFTANKYVESIYPDKEERKKYVRSCTFHPEFGYEHFIEGYRPHPKDEQMLFTLETGIFKKLCDEARKHESKDFYLIIDEINRGDIPRIFGELITLIEKDKRRGESGESEVILPLSQESFTVPSNVYIIATMNTADRSIALLDTALRRRFGFLPMLPDSSVFEDKTFNEPSGGEKSLKSWFEELNGRLKEALKNSRHDVEHILVGHSYFLPTADLVQARFVQVIRHEILPLIEEYCYEDKDAFGKMKRFIKETTGVSPVGDSGSASAGNENAETQNGGTEQ